MKNTGRGQFRRTPGGVMRKFDAGKLDYQETSLTFTAGTIILPMIKRGTALLLLFSLLVHWLVVKTDPNISFIVTSLSFHQDEMTGDEALFGQEEGLDIQVSSMAYRTEKLTWIKYSLTVTNQQKSDDSLHVQIVKADFSHRLNGVGKYVDGADDPEPNSGEFLVNQLVSNYIVPLGINYPVFFMTGGDEAPVSFNLPVVSDYRSTPDDPPEFC